MKYKLIILSIFLVSLLAVSAVSAADDTLSDVVGTNNNINETVISPDSINIDDDNVDDIETRPNEIYGSASVDTINELLTQTEENYGNASAGTFEDLQREINNAPEWSVLYLTRDYNAVSGQSVHIDKPLTIDGQGHTLDCLKKCRAFSYFSSTKRGPTFKNLKIINGYENNGGALRIDCFNWKVENCVFINNTAYGEGGDSTGGAIASHGSTSLDVINCQFIDNKANGTGGAIYCNYLKCENTVFIRNSVDTDGGAIYCDKYVGDPGEVRVNQCLFEDNIAEKRESLTVACQGGAIYCQGNAIAINSEFKYNKAHESGGAIFVEDSVEVAQCLFEYNRASGAELEIHQCKGGAIYADVNVKVTNSVFKNNYADEYAGAIYAGTVDIISNSTFMQNQAYFKDGGAIYINKKCNSKFYACLFEKNSCGARGGAIYIDSSYAETSIIRCSFVDNTAGKEGKSVFNCGDYKDVSQCWYGTNSPSFTGQFRIWHSVQSNEDYTPSEYAKLGLKMNDDTFYMGNQYVVTAYFYQNTNPDETMNDIPYRELIFFTDAGIISNIDYHHELTKNVTFTKESDDAIMRAYLNHETVTLPIIVKYKNPTSINIYSCPDIYYGDTLLVRFHISKNNNATYEVKDSNGRTIVKGQVKSSPIKLRSLNMGQYTITIANPETLSDLPSSATADFKVIKKATASVSTNHVEYGFSTRISVESDVDGKYLVSINDTMVVEINVRRGTGHKYINLDAGLYKTHTICSDSWVDLTVSETEFNVDKGRINIDLSVDRDIVYPNNVTGVITTNVPGKYEITLAPLGIAQNITLGDEPYRFNLGTVPVQSYTIRVVSKEVDKNYDDGSDYAQINVVKGTPSISLSIPDANPSDEVYAYAHGSVDGIYTLKINDIERTMNITNSMGTLNLGYLDVGNYSARLDFAGDDNYNPAYNTTSFKVSKSSIEFKLNTSGSDFVYGDEIDVTHVLPVKATGYIFYKLNNEIYANLTVNENLTLHDLDVGSYLIEATYSGDYNYESSKDTLQIRISKAQNNVKVSVVDVTYGTLSIIRIQSDVDGTYTVDINGTTVDIDVINGSGVNSVGLNAGLYSTHTVFDSKNYDTKITEADFKVLKATDNVRVSVDNVSYGQYSIVNLDADVDGLYTVNINGTSLSVNVTNGKGSQKIKLDLGKYITETTFDNDNYQLNVEEAVFEVGKVTNNVYVVVGDVVYGESSVIIINADVDGIYIVNMGNTNVSVDVVNGSGENSVKLNAGTYTTGTSFDNPCYVNNITEAVFHVLKADVALRIVVLDCTYPNNVGGSIFADVDGLYTVKIGNYTSIVDITDNVGSFDVGVLDAGVYNATVIFDGDDNHNANTNMTAFTVNKRAVDFRINANATDVVYGDSIEVIPVFDAEVNGTIKYSVDGNVFCEVPVSESVIFADLDAGSHVILADYSGDKNIKKASTTVKINVNKSTNIVKINVGDVSYGMQSVILVTADVDGIYYVDVNGNTLEVNVSNNKGNASISLDVGTYHTTTRFNNKNYVSQISDADFDVVKANITLIVDIDDNAYGENINGSVHASVDGVYALTIGNYKTSVTVVGGMGLINETLLLDVGDYEAEIYFTGDNNHNNASNITAFHINKIDTTLYVLALDTLYPNIVFGAVATDCNDTVKVYLNDEFKFSIHVDEIEIFDLSILGVGDYNITAVFDGNQHYNAVSNTSTFNVTQGNVNFTIETNQSSFIYNESVVISHTLTEGATGSIQYYLYDGTLLGEADVGENFTLPVFDCGEYVIVGNYGGDAVYNSAMGMLTVKINKAPNNVVVNVEDVSYGMPSVINVYADVDGVYAVKVNGRTVNVEVLGGEGSRSVVLDAGNYTTKTVFYNNKNYDAVITESDFEVRKADIELNLLIEDVSYPDDVVGVVYASVDGKYDVKIGNVTSTVNVKNGMGRFNIGVLDGGDYDATVLFNGTSNYNENMNSTTFTVNKANITLIINVKDCVYHDDVVVDVHASIDGKYRLIVGSVNTTFDVINNEAVVNVGELNAGDYVAYVLFDGNRNYNSNSNITNFTVDKAKANITIDINGTEFVYGNHITVTHNLTEDALGYITYFLGDGSEIAQTSVDTDYILPILDVGEYWIIALYEGDGNYYPAVDLVKFSIVPAANCAIVNVSDVTYGTPSIIQIQADVDGNYTLDVNGSKYIIPVINGMGFYSLDLDAGQYYANISFNDKNYNTECRNAVFWVNRALNNVVVNVSDVMYGYHSLIEVSADLDGIYYVEVNGTVYNITVQDKFGYRSVLLDVGNFTTKTVFYDKNYDNVITEAEFEVYKVDIPYVFFFVDNTTYGEPVEIYMVSPVNGVYNVSLNDVWFDVEVIDHFGVYYIDVLDAGDYVLFTSCDGDEHFNPTNTSESFTVFKANNTATVNVSDVTYPGDVVVTIKSDVAGNYSLFIGTSSPQYVVLEAGVARDVTLAGLDAGTYEFTVALPESDNYNEVRKSVNATVAKGNVNMSITSAGDVTYSEDIVLTLLSDVSGNYSLQLGTTTPQHVVLEAGAAKNITFSGYGAGTYRFALAYLETKNYNAAIEFVIVTVNKVENTTISVEATSPVVGENATVTVTLPDDATGTVSVKYGNGVYTAPVENGTAIISVPTTIVGTETASVTYSGDDNYESVSSEVNITVKVQGIIIAENIKRAVNSPYDYYATLVDAEGKPIDDVEITFTIGGKTYKAKTNASGIAVVSAGLEVVDGKDTVYNVTVTNPYTFENTTATTTIVPRLIVVSGDLTADYHENPPYVVQAIGDDGEPVGAGVTVRIVFAGFYYDLKTNETGHVVRTIALAPGTYAVRGEYMGYKTEQTLFKVLQILQASSGKIVKTAKSYTIKATLKYTNGTPLAGKRVKLNFNGKNYNVVTNAKGVASYTLKSNDIKKLKAGKTYLLKALYVNDWTRGKWMGKISVISHAINAKKTTTVKKNAKSLSVKITLNDGSVLKNKKVTIKFKGKTYNVKTNNKGVAYFKLNSKVIKTLNKGKTYTYIIKYSYDTLNRYIIVK